MEEDSGPGKQDPLMLSYDICMPYCRLNYKNNLYHSPLECTGNIADSSAGLQVRPQSCYCYPHSPPLPTYREYFIHPANQ